VGRNGSLRLGYTGSRTIKLLNALIENRARVAPDLDLRLDNIDARRPNPAYWDVNRILNGGRAWYDAAQAGFDWRRRGGVAWGATYTFSKAIDEGADYTNTAANRDLSRNRPQAQQDGWIDRKGLSNFDSTHTLMVYGTWDVPGPRGWRGLASGWQVSGNVLARSGTPLSLYVGSDAPGFGNVDGSPSDRPNIVDASILGLTIDHPDLAPRILTRDKFRYIVTGQPRGNLGRGTFRKDAIANVNAAVSRQWRLPRSSERLLIFRAEAFNLTNHPQFDEPQRNLTSPAFGRITNTLNDGRVMQLGVRLVL
jgi:hypothetical protein